MTPRLLLTIHSLHFQAERRRPRCLRSRISSRRWQILRLDPRHRIALEVRVVKEVGTTIPWVHLPTIMDALQWKGELRQMIMEDTQRITKGGHLMTMDVNQQRVLGAGRLEVIPHKGPLSRDILNQDEAHHRVKATGLSRMGTEILAITIGEAMIRVRLHRRGKIFDLLGEV